MAEPTTQYKRLTPAERLHMFREVLRATDSVTLEAKNGAVQEFTPEEIQTLLSDAAAAERAAIRAEVEAEMADDGGRLSALAIIDAREP